MVADARRDRHATQCDAVQGHVQDDRRTTEPAACRLQRASLTSREVLTADGSEVLVKLARYESGPDRLPPDRREARKLLERWTSQESEKDYRPPDESWPPEKAIGFHSEVSSLRAAFEKCGGRATLESGRFSTDQQHACHEVAFKLAMALHGGRLSGHYVETPEEERSTEERAEGAELMCALAAAGSRDGACAWAFILSSGDIVDMDSARAASFHRQAAASGHVQSMHELGTMYYLGEGVAEDAEAAVYWFRKAASAGICSSMFLLGECLLEGYGTEKDTVAALGWFAAAGELGHRGARSRLAEALRDRDRYRLIAGIKKSRWIEQLDPNRAGHQDQPEAEA